MFPSKKRTKGRQPYIDQIIDGNLFQIQTNIDHQKQSVEEFIKTYNMKIPAVVNNHILRYMSKYFTSSSASSQYLRWTQCINNGKIVFELSFKFCDITQDGYAIFTICLNIVAMSPYFLQNTRYIFGDIEIVTDNSPQKFSFVATNYKYNSFNVRISPGKCVLKDANTKKIKIKINNIQTMETFHQQLGNKCFSTYWTTFCAGYENHLKQFVEDINCSIDQLIIRYCNCGLDDTQNNYNLLITKFDDMEFKSLQYNPRDVLNTFCDGIRFVSNEILPSNFAFTADGIKGSILGNIPFTLFSNPYNLLSCKNILLSCDIKSHILELMIDVHLVYMKQPHNECDVAILKQNLEGNQDAFLFVIFGYESTICTNTFLYLDNGSSLTDQYCLDKVQAIFLCAVEVYRQFTNLIPISNNDPETKDLLSNTINFTECIISGTYEWYSKLIWMSNANNAPFLCNYLLSNIKKKIDGFIGHIFLIGELHLIIERPNINLLLIASKVQQFHYLYLKKQNTSITIDNLYKKQQTTLLKQFQTHKSIIIALQQLIEAVGLVYFDGATVQLQNKSDLINDKHKIYEILLKLPQSNFYGQGRKSPSMQEMLDIFWDAERHGAPPLDHKMNVSIQCDDKWLKNTETKTIKNEELSNMYYDSGNWKRIHPIEILLVVFFCIFTLVGWSRN